MIFRLEHAHVEIPDVRGSGEPHASPYGRTYGRTYGYGRMDIRMDVRVGAWTYV